MLELSVIIEGWDALLQKMCCSIKNGVRSSNGVAVPEITRNYGNYRYSNYVGNAPRR